MTIQPTPADEALAPKLSTPVQYYEPYGKPLDVVEFGGGYSFVCYHTYGPYTLHKDGKPARVTSKYNSNPWAACVSETDGQILRDLAAAHVAAQAPSGSGDLYGALEELYNVVKASKLEGLEYVGTGIRVTNALAAHKAQPVADVRGMVEALEASRKSLEDCQIKNEDQLAKRDHALKQVYAALASARHAMGGVKA